ncbi:hypothetical protein BGX31_002489 [Mortierella sp. GBA43]|nr:hypothetical protein BGX31_002489 [Mortierella sp. GBA43]
MTNTALITRATRGRGSRAASSQEGVVQVHTPRRHVTPGDGDMDAGAQDRDSDTSTSKDSDGIDSGSEPSDDVIDSDVIDGDVTDGDDSDSDVDNSDSVDANAAGDINPMANAEPTSGNSVMQISNDAGLRRNFLQVHLIPVIRAAMTLRPMRSSRPGSKRVVPVKYNLK